MIQPTYTVVDESGPAIQDYGKGRRCEGCGEPVSRYQGPTDGFVACFRCQDARLRMDVPMHEFLRRPYREVRRGPGRPKGSPDAKPRKHGGGRPPGLRTHNLGRLMCERDVSAPVLAEMVDLSVETVRRLRRGTRGVSDTTAERLADALGVRVEDLA